MTGIFDTGEDWSFWDLASPLRATVVLAEIYGADAASKAMECVVSARTDGHEDDHRFWTAVYAGLQAVERRRTEAI